MTGRQENERDSAPDVTIVAGRYEVEDEIGRGGMGTVYRARQVGLDRVVAVKLLRPPHNADDAASFDRRFRREAETLAKFDHPSIVRIFDFGSTGKGQLFLAMELVEGPSLSDLVKDRPMPPHEILPLILQVCSGLRYAHQRGAVHRDLKPSNLLVKDRGEGRRRVKIVDFGLVKLVDEDHSLTGDGLILGSPHCMAPEQVRGEEMDHRVDIYALGVVLFRCLTGVYPFQRKNLAATMMGHLNDPVPRLSEVAPDLDLPDGLEWVVEQCMQKDPDDRFSSVDEIIDHLAAILDVSPSAFRSGAVSHSSLRSPVVRQQTPPPPPAPPAPIRKRTLVAAGMALGGVMVGGMVALIGGWLALSALPIPTAPETPRLPVSTEAAPNGQAGPTPAPDPKATRADAPPPPSPTPRRGPVVEHAAAADAAPAAAVDPEPLVDPFADEPLADDASAEPQEEGEEAPPSGYMSMPEDL